jgi:hypothetical protein
MSFHQIEEHDNHFVFHHKNGHEVKIAKKGLSDKTINKIKGFAEGGPVSKDEADKFMQGYMKQSVGGGSTQQQTNPKLTQANAQQKKPIKLNEGTPDGTVEDEMPQEAPSPSIGERIGQNVVAPTAQGVMDTFHMINTLGHGAANFLGDVTRGTVKGVKGQGNPNVKKVADEDIAAENAMPQQQQSPIPQSPQNIPLGQAPQQAPNPLLMGTGEAYKEAYETGAKGIEQQKQAESELGQAQAGVYDQQIAQQQQLLDNYQLAHQKVEAERDAIKQDILDNKIDSRRVFNDMSTGQKFMTGVAMVLGGFGSGATGGRNVVLDQLNKMIDTDIDEQKANIGKSENLLARNLQEEGNIKDAMLATKVQMGSILEAQLQKNLANAKTPQAQAAASQALANWQNQFAPITEQYKIRKAMLSSMQQGGAGGVSPEMYIRAVVPEKEREAALKELKEVQVMQKTKLEALRIFDKFANESGHGVFSPNQKKALLADMKAEMAKEAAGRFTALEGEAFETKFPVGTDFSRETIKQKRASLANFFDRKMGSPLLTSLGVPLPQPTSTKPISVNSQGYTQAGYKK